MLWWLADFHADGLANGRATVELEAGSVHEICIDGDAGAESPLQFRFAQLMPEWRQAKLDEAVAASDAARAVICIRL